MLNSVRNSAADSLAVLRSDAEGLIDETDLGSDISLEQPPNLSFSDHVHRLVSSYRVQRTGHGAKPKPGAMRFLMNRWSCSTILFK
jgi:hypothetical protein